MPYRLTAVISDFNQLRRDLDGTAVMEVLGLSPGPMVGAAIRHLQDVRAERGMTSREEAVLELRAWAERLSEK
ncbi:hypothetical protein ABGB18_33545 [Nonomuraea sp. B12E4]|uniref:hypothetical protein n=1 Tax=Nonomuraea sp. B12E4 TaxID=3153564 RepID=UPI00325EF40D